MTGIYHTLPNTYIAKNQTAVPRNVSAVVAGFVQKDRNNCHKADAAKMRRALMTGSETLASNAPVSVVDSMKLYSMALKKARQTSKNTELEKKKLKYSFKKVSSKIISCKTSTAAREAVSMAKREVEKLRKEARSGKYDPEEIGAALDHAKAMERIARKKVKHLEQEEMAKRCSKGEDGNGTAATDSGSLEDKKDPAKEEIDGLRDELQNVEDKAENEEYIESEEITNEMIKTVCDGMEEMLDAIEELNELMDELVSAPTDMDPEDIKSMEIRHRNKEMKDMTKADGDYLKTMFEHFENLDIVL